MSGICSGAGGLVEGKFGARRGAYGPGVAEAAVGFFWWGRGSQVL